MQQMMEQIRQMMRAGSRDAARQMLSQLRNMLESLRNARASLDRILQTQRANEALRQLQEMIRRQSELIDQTFRQFQDRNAGQSQIQRGAREQQKLRDMLKHFRKMMKGIMPGKDKRACNRWGGRARRWKMRPRLSEAASWARRSGRKDRP